MKILFMTDTHLTAKSPQSRTDIYETTTLKKFTEIGHIIKNNNVDLVIHGGDMFHTAKVSLRYAGHIAEIIKSWGVPVHVVPGNHDVYGYNLSTIDQTILGLYSRSGVIKLLTRDNPLLVDINGSTLAIEGQEYYADIDKGNMTDYRIDTVGADYSLLVTHSMLLPKPFFPDIPHTLIENVVTDANLVLAGHYHPGFDEVLMNGTYFINPGATIRVESSRMEIPKVMVLDFQEKPGGGIVAGWDYIKLQSAKPREDVFDIANKLAKKHSNQVVTAFKQDIESIESLKNANSITDMVLAMSSEMQIPKDVSNIAIKHITDAEIAEEDMSATINGFIPKNYNLTIKTVTIKNFQSHAHTVINFEKSMNVITGESNQGKTAVIRAIQWCLFNEPKGTDFIRTGESDCSVTVEFSDNSSITRSRTLTSSGYYKIKDSSGEEKVYKGFGNDIPVEVQNEHQMPDVYITKDTKVKLNLATQLEGPFLIGDSPSVRASAIGRLTGVQVLDSAIKNCNRNLMATNKEVKVLESKLEGFDKELAKYNNLNDLKLYLNIIEELSLAKESYESDVSTLRDYQNTLDGIERDRLDKIKVLSSIPDTTGIESLLSELDTLYGEAIGLTNYSEELTKLRNNKFNCNNTIKCINDIVAKEELVHKVDELINSIESIMYYKSVRVDLFMKINNCKKVIENLSNINELFEVVSKVSLEIDNLTAAVNIKDSVEKLKEEISHKENDICNIDSNIELNTKLLSEQESLLSDMVSNEKTCPLCGSDFTVEHILSEVD